MCLEHVGYINRPKDVVSWVKGRIRLHPHVFHIINIHYCHGLETKKQIKQSVKRINFDNIYIFIKHIVNAIS